MTKKKGKKIVIKNGKKQESLLRRTMPPLLENPIDILDDINTIYYKEDPWMQPWWNRWKLSQSLGMLPENRMKLIPVDLVDTGKTYQIITEMPGVNKKDIEVLVTSKTISICGATETNIRKENEGYVRRERGYSTLCRYLVFPEDVDPDKAAATLNNGILQINVSKKSPSKKSSLVPVK